MGEVQRGVGQIQRLHGEPPEELGPSLGEDHGPCINCGKPRNDHWIQEGVEYPDHYLSQEEADERDRLAGEAAAAAAQELAEHEEAARAQADEDRAREEEARAGDPGDYDE